MSNRCGLWMPTSLYEPTPLTRPGKLGVTPAPCVAYVPAVRPGAGGVNAPPARLYVAGIVVESSLPPTSSPALVFPLPPEMTPFEIESEPTATPSFVDAIVSSVWRRYADAARYAFPVFWIDWLPTVAPLFGVMSVSFSMT